LGLIRHSIDKHPERLKKVVTAEGFATEFLGGLSKKDEETLVKLFAAKNGEDALKTAPKVWQSHTLHHTDPALLYRLYRLRERLFGMTLISHRGSEYIVTSSASMVDGSVPARKRR
jgi:hypothetical protein